jgi:hypothetical protein
MMDAESNSLLSQVGAILWDEKLNSCRYLSSFSDDAASDLFLVRRGLPPESGYVSTNANYTRGNKSSLPVPSVGPAHASVRILLCPNVRLVRWMFAQRP